MAAVANNGIVFQPVFSGKIATRIIDSISVVQWQLIKANIMWFR